MNKYPVNRFLILIAAVFAFTVSHPSQANVPSKREIMVMVVAEAQKQNFPPQLALAVAKAESDFQPDSVSSAGALGVMQVLPATGRSEYGLSPSSLLDPKINIRTGIHFLKSLMATYGRTDIALSHYNGGSRVRRSDGTLHVLPATRRYVNKVMGFQDQFNHHILVTNARTWERGFGNQVQATRLAVQHIDATRRFEIVARLQDLQAHNNRRTTPPHQSVYRQLAYVSAAQRAVGPGNWQAW